MILFRKATDLKNHLQKLRSARVPIGFVPTMGALHRGHLSLIAASKEHRAVTICSIFINPTQFNDPNDFIKYPKKFENDIYLLEQHGTDILFLPGVEEIYPGGTEQLKQYDLGYLETVLEGSYRPGHFQGVCQVMDRLLGIVEPDDLFMGQKDYQQCMVVKRLMEINQSPTRFHSCPTEREPDGLAMSSRNARLNEWERKHAGAIYQALVDIRSHQKLLPIAELIARAKKALEAEDFVVDYIAIANAATLQLLNEWPRDEAMVALIAAAQHEVRLIDNLLLNAVPI